MRGCPPVVLWAWERPEDLGFIDTAKTGCAYLACRVTIEGKKVEILPRTQKLTVSPGTYVIAVVRVESSSSHPPLLCQRQLQEVSNAVISVAARKQIRAIQLDFDARQKERKFYRELLVEVRKNLPDHMPLTMTALASWCMHDNWLDGLPVDEVVPMLFRMGVDNQHVVNSLEQGDEIAAGLLQGSFGIATDEKTVWLQAGKAMAKMPGRAKRIYLFSPKSWSQSDALERISEVSSWLNGSQTR